MRASPWTLRIVKALILHYALSVKMLLPNLNENGHPHYAVDQQYPLLDPCE